MIYLFYHNKSFGKFKDKERLKLRCLGQKELIISFSGQFFQKLLRQGGFILYFFIASDQNEGFYFFPAKV